jgi:hypothetical protein
MKLPFWATSVAGLAFAFTAATHADPAALRTAAAKSAMPGAKVRGVDAIWYGTAPHCNAQQSDCGPGLYYWMDNSSGDGAECLRGHKVLCVSVPTSNYSGTEWIGTAPACGGEVSDCTGRGEDYIVNGSSGDGHWCSSGHKVLCAKH